MTDIKGFLRTLAVSQESAIKALWLTVGCQLL